MGAIYALKFANQVYVGRSLDPKRRFIQHMSNVRRGRKGAAAAWIRDLLNRGQQVDFMVLQTCVANEAAQAERQWLARMSRQGLDLINFRDPGEDLPTPKPRPVKRQNGNRDEVLRIICTPSGWHKHFTIQEERNLWKLEQILNPSAARRRWLAKLA